MTAQYQLQRSIYSPLVSIPGPYEFRIFDSHRKIRWECCRGTATIPRKIQSIFRGGATFYSMLLDRNRIQRICGNKPGSMTSLLSMFTEELPDIKAAILEALRDGNSRQLALSCHRLKSATGYFITDDFYTEIAELEHLSRQHSQRDCTMHWESINRKLLALLAEVRALPEFAANEHAET